MFTLSPLTREKWRRFCQIKRGYYSFLLLGALMVAALFAELWINHRALIVKYEGRYYFPTYTAFHPGTDFGLGYPQETDYRLLKETFRKQKSGNWVILPLVPYSPNENNFPENGYPPTAPSWSDGHWLGTDTTGRDILARLIYGFRIAIFFALAYMVLIFILAGITGGAMGYFGGKVDLIGQRFVEIWGNIPFLYMVIIISSLLPSGIPIWIRVSLLLGIMVIFDWTGMSYYFRTQTYKEKSRDYVAAARVLGSRTPRLLFQHILPNIISTVVTFIPFKIAGAITTLSALDYLGFGLPAPTPSWGELLKQGTANLQAPWIVSAAFVALVLVLILVTFIGEAVREAFDPKKFTLYQ